MDDPHCVLVDQHGSLVLVDDEEQMLICSFVEDRKHQVYAVHSFAAWKFVDKAFFDSSLAHAEDLSSVKFVSQFPLDHKELSELTPSNGLLIQSIKNDLKLFSFLVIHVDVPFNNFHELRH